MPVINFVQIGLELDYVNFIMYTTSNPSIIGEKSNLTVTKCSKCDKIGHFAAKCYRKDGNKNKKVGEVKEAEEPATVNMVTEDFFGEFAEVNELSMTEEVELSPLMIATLGQKEGSRSVGHHNCDRYGRWRRGQVEPHGRVRLRMEICSGAYGQVDESVPGSLRSTTASCLADTGAQMCLAGPDVLTRMGISVSDLLTPVVRISVANNAGLKMLGVAFVTFTGKGGTQTNQMLYFADGIDDVYLSKVACRDLGIIPEEFPAIGVCGKGQVC